MPTNLIAEVRRQALLSIAFNGLEPESALKKHGAEIKFEIHEQLKKFADTHYFWLWCLQNWELFGEYSEEHMGIIARDVQIFGQNLKTDPLVLTITDDRTAILQLTTDRFLLTYKYCNGIK